MKFQSFAILASIAMFWSCNQKFSKQFITPETVLVQTREEADPSKKNPCATYLNYAPDSNFVEHTPMKYVRINIHFINSRDSMNNLWETEGVAYAKEMVRATNLALEENYKAALPENNQIPVLPIQYRYVLTGDSSDSDGIYFHYDDEAFYYIAKGRKANLFDKQQYLNYAKRKGEVLNIFFMAHHPDSLMSSTYSATSTGVALGKHIKICSSFEPGTAPSPWRIRGTFNHEVGHILSLSHAWAYNDGCDDTPKHSLKVRSSNVMDYNSPQLSFTPCQIGKIHFRMASLGSTQRGFLEPRWCEINPDADITIVDSIHWKGAKDLEGNLRIGNDAVLKVSCRLSIPRGAKIVVAPEGKLILDGAKIHNSCGDLWQGIEIEKSGKKQGKVILLNKPKLENMEHPFVVSSQ